MKVVITGTTGLANALYKALSPDNEVVCISRSTGQDIKLASEWCRTFADFGCCINCAYDDQGQLTVLESFYHMWQDDSSKTIINIGSKVASYARTETDKDHLYFRYRVNKQALQLAFESMCNTARCDIKLINPGPIDTEMTSHLNVNKLNTDTLAQQIVDIMNYPHIKRVDLWQ